MKIAKSLISFFIWYIGKFYSYLYSYRIKVLINKNKCKIYSAWISREFKEFGKDSTVFLSLYLRGGKYISIGNKTSIGSRAVLTAWDKYGEAKFYPEIIIGDSVSIGDDAHITAINRIEIGNNVLMGKKITITDNSHGKSDIELLSFPPISRPLFSSGPVIIEDGVWIGDKVTILPNVRIGRNAVIGSNAVVTKNVSANCIVGGIPAKVIKVVE